MRRLLRLWSTTVEPRLPGLYSLTLYTQKNNQIRSLICKMIGFRCRSMYTYILKRTGLSLKFTDLFKYQFSHYLCLFRTSHFPRKPKACLPNVALLSTLKVICLPSITSLAFRSPELFLHTAAY